MTDVAAAPAWAHRALARARAHRPRGAHGALSRGPALGEAGALEPRGERLSPALRSSPRPARPPEVWPLSPQPRSGTSSGRAARAAELCGDGLRPFTAAALQSPSRVPALVTQTALRPQVTSTAIPTAAFVQGTKLSQYPWIPAPSPAPDTDQLQLMTSE